jgi:RNA polymerase sigma-70 factor (ECF subfamily)
MDQFLAGVEARAYRMAVIATSSHEDALDIVQDAMLRLVRRYANHAEDEWPPLFYRVLQSAIRDWYRRNTVRNRWRQIFKGRQGDDETLEDPIENMSGGLASEPGTQVANERAIKALDSLLHQLPLRQQQAFLLRQWEGLSVSETATAMGCSEGSVKTHLSRAIKTLRAQLQDHWLEM